MPEIINANSIQLDKQPPQVVAAGSIQLDKQPVLAKKPEPEPMAFDFEGEFNMRGDVSQEKIEETKRAFASIIHPFTQPWQNVGYSAAASLNRGTALFATHLDHIADRYEKMTGMKKGGILTEWAKKYNENADYWQKQASENGATFLQEFFGEVAGGAVPGIAEFILNVPYATLLGAAESEQKGRGEVAGALIESAKRGALGAVFHTIGSFNQYLRAPMMGGVFLLQAAAEGGNLKEVAKAGATGAIYSLTSPGGKIGLNDIKRNLEIQTVKDMAAEPARELSPDASTAMVVDKKNESANISDVTTPKGTASDIPAKTTPKAEAWNPFKDSVVQDVVYHGTNKTFDKFGRQFLGVKTGAKSAKEGYFFTKSESLAKHYARELQEFNKLKEPDAVTQAINNTTFDNLGSAQEILGTSEKVTARNLLNNILDYIETQSNIPKELRNAFYDATVAKYRLGRYTPTAEGQKYFSYIDAKDKIVDMWQNYNAEIKNVYLDIKNPYIYKGDSTSITDAKPSVAGLIRKAKSLGHDSIIFESVYDGTSEVTDIYVVFKQKQIRILPNPSRPPEVGGQTVKNADTSTNFAPEANFRRQPEQAEKTDDITRRSDLVRFLNEKLDIPIRTGRFRDKALGIFKLRSEVIRTEKANDIEVIAHEIGHAIQKFLYPEAVTQSGLASRPFSAFKNELDPMATQPKAGQDVTPEGFAEFIRLYITDQQMARDKAPLFYDHFEKELQNKSPETKEILLEARKQYERWLKQPELQRVLSQVSVGAKDKREVSFDKIYTAAIDDLLPLENIVKTMAKGEKLPAGEDPYILARLLRGYTGKADAFIDHSPFKFKTYEDVGKSLKSILAPVRGDLDTFRAYIVSRRTIDLERRKIETGVLPADARKVIKDYDAKFKQAFDELKEYQDLTLQYLKDSGVMDQKTYDQIKQMNDDYVPLYRIMDEKPGKAGAGTGMIARNPVKKITGSWRDIQDPLESIIKNTYLYINAAEKNAVGRALVDLAQKNEGMGKFVEKIPTPMQQIKITPEELQKAGVEELPESVVSIFRPAAFMPQDNVISVWNEGKRELFEVHPDVAKTFMALDKENLNLLMRVLSKPASWLRAGATLTPEYIARNPLRDQFSAFAYSKYGFVPGYDLVKGIFSMARKDQMYWDWKKGGGDHSMLVSMDRDYLQDKLGQTLTKYPVLNRIKNPIELLRIASELGEEGTRIGEFKKGVKAEWATKEGIQAAAFASRDVTLDFSRVGTIGKSVNIITAFWNAQVQGMDKMVREFKENTVRTTAKVVAAITLPSVLLSIATHDDPRIKEVPAWERDLFWIIPTENHLWRIPKPFELGVIFGSVPERITHYILDQDPHAFDELLTTVVSGATPGLVPTAAIPIMENWANKSVFFNRSIVPTGRTELLPEYQYGPYTTDTAKEIGKIIGKLPWEIEQASPARIENLVRGWTGGLGMYALNIADQGLLNAGIVERYFETPSKTLSEIPFIRAFHVRYPSSNAESIQRFYDNYEKSNQIIKTAKILMEKEYNPDDAIRLLEMNAVNLQGNFEAIGNIRQMINMIYINPEMTGDEKREMIDILYMQMIDIAKSGNQVFDSMKEMED